MIQLGRPLQKCKNLNNLEDVIRRKFNFISVSFFTQVCTLQSKVSYFDLLFWNQSKTNLKPIFLRVPKNSKAYKKLGVWEKDGPLHFMYKLHGFNLESLSKNSIANSISKKKFKKEFIKFIIGLKTVDNRNDSQSTRLSNGICVSYKKIKFSTTCNKY